VRVAKQKYRIERDSVWAFITENLIKANENDKIKLSEIYDKYKLLCQKEEYKSIEKKIILKTGSEKGKYKVDNSTKDRNQIYVFGVRFNEE
jgi:hypothetical protein